MLVGLKSWLRRRRYWAGAGVACVLVAGAALALRHPAADPGAVAAAKPVVLEFRQAQLIHPERRNLDVVLTLPGSVTALQQATVRARISGTVSDVLVREGESVGVGGVLARFDTAPLLAVRAEREADLAQAKATLVAAQRTREANEQLVKQSFITRNAFDTADANFQAQSAAVESAQAKLAQVQLQIDDAVVHAPIAGQISQRQVQPGEKVSQDAALFSIVDLGRLEVQAQADVVDAARIAPGQRAEVIVEGMDGPPFAARVDRINPAADAASRALPLYVDFSNRGQRVRAGMFARVRLHLAPMSASLSLPMAAVQTEAGQSVVWELRDGHLVRHLVTLGRRDESQQRVEILAGIDESATVLASRIDGLSDGAAGRIVTAGS